MVKIRWCNTRFLVAISTKIHFIFAKLFRLIKNNEYFLFHILQEQNGMKRGVSA